MYKKYKLVSSGTNTINAKSLVNLNISPNFD